MASKLIPPEKRAEIETLLTKAAEVRQDLVRGQLAGIVTQAMIDAHDDRVRQLRQIKQQFIDAP